MWTVDLLPLSFPDRTLLGVGEDSLGSAIDEELMVGRGGRSLHVHGCRAEKKAGSSPYKGPEGLQGALHLVRSTTKLELLFSRMPLTSHVTVLCSRPHPDNIHLANLMLDQKRPAEPSPLCRPHNERGPFTSYHARDHRAKRLALDSTSGCNCVHFWQDSDNFHTSH